MFIITKILGFILNPFYWILGILVFIYFLKNDKKRKRLLGLSLFMLLVFSNPWLISRLQYPFHAPPMPMGVNERYEYGIVLGGMTSYDKVNKVGHFNMSSDRFIQTALLYKKGYIKKIVASGGQNGMFLEDDFVEARFIAQNLLDLGIPSADIIIEDSSRNTIENAAFTHKIVNQLGGFKGKAVLITSAFHIPRAMETFEKEGIAVRPYPCAFSILPDDVKIGGPSFIPATWAMDAWAQFLKELIGRAYLKLKG